MTHSLILEVRGALESAADPQKAPKMQAYMKSAMPYRGVSAPEQKAIWRRTFAAHPLPSREQWQEVALSLWRDAAFREERYAAIALTALRKYAPYHTMASVPDVPGTHRDFQPQLQIAWSWELELSFWELGVGAWALILSGFGNLATPCSVRPA